MPRRLSRARHGSRTTPRRRSLAPRGETSSRLVLLLPLVKRHELDDLVAALPRRRLNLDLVADALVEERAAQRRRQGYLPLPRIGLLREDDVVGGGLAGVEVLDRHAAAVG